MLIFVKLGGSLITDKQVERRFRADVARRLASEIKAALDADPDLQLLVGHGSGSFGHVAAKQFGTVDGVHTPEQWRGFAHVATIAAELNHLMAQTLDAAGVPVWRMQPSASALARDGVITEMAVEPIREALDHQLVPLVYGDVALDSQRGGTIISTETIFTYLAQQLPVKRMLLLGEVDGVYAVDGVVIPAITPATLPEVEQALGGSAGTDVTGGMRSKVHNSLAVVQASPDLSIRIMNGLTPGLLRTTLLDQTQPGTLITR